MKFHYMGKYSGDPESLPSREHEPGAVPLKGLSAKALPIVINIIGFIISAALLVPVAVFGVLRVEGAARSALTWIILIILAAVVIFPHEFLHAVCFRGDVYMYTKFKRGICFVVGPELFTKARFILMSLLPNIIIGLIPYIIWMIFPRLWYIGVFGGVGLGMGAGDYINVINCLIQIPKGAKTYVHGMSSFWVRTEKEI